MSARQLLKMYNLNVNVATALPAAGFLGFDSRCNTPRTPEIVNSLVAMTNPFDALVEPPGEKPPRPGSEESCSGTVSPLGSPTTNSPPSVQYTRSQLIKEGLKLTIQTKRKRSGSEPKEDLEEFESKRTKREELTEEDEERRKRRRERNKIAATKCRMKKREKTANLVNESEFLETQNVDLKTQIHDLQKQKKDLIKMLSVHSATCPKRSDIRTFEDFLETYPNGYDERLPNRFQDPETSVGASDGIAMNPYGKDPNFAKLLDDAATTANHPGSFAANAFDDSCAATNYYHTNGGIGSAEPGHGCSSKGKSARDERIARPRKNGYGESAGDASAFFRTSFPPSCGRVANEADEGDDEGDGGGGGCDDDDDEDEDDADSYKPNGIIDGNFFANRTDSVFGGGNEYANAFGNGALDNGCMA